MRLVRSTGDVSIPVHDLGGSGPPLLLCHATGFHGLVWGPFAPLLASRFRVWSLDFRGHGDASPPPSLPVDWRGFGDDVLAVVDDLELEEPVAFGHSMGGAALVLAESERPGTFRRLALFEPIVFPTEGPPGGGGDLAAGARRRRPVFPSRDQAFANFASKPPLSSFVPEALRAYVDHGLADRPEGDVELKCRPEVEAATYEGAPAHPGWSRLASVSCPVVVMAGEHTEAVGPGALARLQADRLPAGRVEVVPGIGHFGPMEDPPLVAGTVGAALLGD